MILEKEVLSIHDDKNLKVIRSEKGRIFVGDIHYIIDRDLVLSEEDFCKFEMKCEKGNGEYKGLNDTIYTVDSKHVGVLPCEYWSSFKKGIHYLGTIIRKNIVYVKHENGILKVFSEDLEKLVEIDTNKCN